MKSARIATDTAMDFRFSLRKAPRSFSVKKEGKKIV